MHGIPAYRENQGEKKEKKSVFFSPSRKLTIKRKKIDEESKKRKSSRAPQGVRPVVPGAGGQWLLTCLMVRFPSSIQPARGCSHRAAVGRAEIHQVSHRKQVSLPPLPCLFFPHPFYSLLGGSPKTMSSFPTFFPQPMKSRQRGGNCPPGSDFKPQPRDGVVGGAGPRNSFANQEEGEGGRAHKGCCLHED